jgi:putative endonuclease
MFYTYVLQSIKDGKFYTGYTCDLRKRLNEHNSNKVFSTKSRGSFRLIYYEACINKDDAKAREKYIKSGMGKRYLKNRLTPFRNISLPKERFIYHAE